MGRPRDYCGYFVTNNHGIKPYKNDYLNLSLNESAKQTFHILIEIQRVREIRTWKLIPFAATV